MLGFRGPRLPVVNGKSPKNLAILRSNRRRPAGSKTMMVGKLLEVCPQWIVGNIRDHDLLPAINCCATRSRAWSDLKPINCPTIFLGKTGTRARSQSGSVALEKKNGTQQAAISLLDFRANGFQDIRERSRGHN